MVRKLTRTEAEWLLDLLGPQHVTPGIGSITVAGRKFCVIDAPPKPKKATQLDAIEIALQRIEFMVERQHRAKYGREES